MDLVYGFDDALVVAPRNEDIVELPIESGKAVQVHPIGCVAGNFQQVTEQLSVVFVHARHRLLQGKRFQQRTHLVHLPHLVGSKVTNPRAASRVEVHQPPSS